MKHESSATPSDMNCANSAQPAILDELSVFLPIFNEADRISRTIDNVLQVLPRMARRHELILVNDGSQDATQTILEAWAARVPTVRIIAHPVNRGYGAALRSGLYGSRYAWIAFMDSDGQFDFGEIAVLLDRQQRTQADLVVGYYRKRSVSIQRKVNTLLWQSLVRPLFGLRVRAIDCGFKLMRRAVVEGIAPLESERGAFISTELLAKARNAGFSIDQAPVSHHPRRGGTATGASLPVIARSFQDLARLHRRLAVGAAGRGRACVKR